MPCPFTGPKMFCAGPNFLSQPKNLTAFSASSKTFGPMQKCGLAQNILGQGISFTTCHNFAFIFLVCLGFKKEELFKVAWPRPKYTFAFVRYCFQSRPIKRESVHETSVTWTKQVIRFWSCKLTTKLNSSFYNYRL